MLHRLRSSSAAPASSTNASATSQATSALRVRRLAMLPPSRPPSRRVSAVPGRDAWSAGTRAASTAHAAEIASVNASTLASIAIASGRGMLSPPIAMKKPVAQ